MKTACSLNELRNRYNLRELVVSCGVFDGVHRGHQRILTRLLKLAQREQATPVVVTFNPHPRAVLTPEQRPQYLTRTDQQLALFRRLGVPAAVVLPFDQQMAAMSAETFLTEQLVPGHVKVKAVCVGENWRFGHSSHGGDLHTLQQRGRREGFEDRKSVV